MINVLNSYYMPYIKIGNMVELKSWNELVNEFGDDNGTMRFCNSLELPDGYTISKSYLTRDAIYDKIYEGTPDKFVIKKLGDDLYNWASHKVSPYMVKPIPNLKEKLKVSTKTIFDWYCNEFKRCKIVRDSEKNVLGIINVQNAKELYYNLLLGIESNNYFRFTTFDIIMINRIWNWYVDYVTDRKNAYLMHFNDGDSMMTEQWVYYFETNIKHQNKFII